MSAPPQNCESEVGSVFFRNYGTIEPAARKDGGRSGRRQIGFMSAIFIIFNCTVGAGWVSFCTSGTTGVLRLCAAFLLLQALF